MVVTANSTSSGAASRRTGRRSPTSDRSSEPSYVSPAPAPTSSEMLAVLDPTVVKRRLMLADATATAVGLGIAVALMALYGSVSSGQIRPPPRPHRSGAAGIRFGRRRQPALSLPRQRPCRRRDAQSRPHRVDRSGVHGVDRLRSADEGPVTCVGGTDRHLGHGGTHGRTIRRPPGVRPAARLRTHAAPRRDHRHRPPRPGTQQTVRQRSRARLRGRRTGRFEQQRSRGARTRSTRSSSCSSAAVRAGS